MILDSKKEFLVQNYIHSKSRVRILGFNFVEERQVVSQYQI